MEDVNHGETGPTLPSSAPDVRAIADDDPRASHPLFDRANSSPRPDQPSDLGDSPHALASAIAAWVRYDHAHLACTSRYMAKELTVDEYVGLCDELRGDFMSVSCPWRRIVENGRPELFSMKITMAARKMDVARAYGGTTAAEIEATAAGRRRGTEKAARRNEAAEIMALYPDDPRVVDAARRLCGLTRSDDLARRVDDLADAKGAPALAAAAFGVNRAVLQMHVGVARTGKFEEARMTYEEALGALRAARRPVNADTSALSSAFVAAYNAWRNEIHRRAGEAQDSHLAMKAAKRERDERDAERRARELAKLAAQAKAKEREAKHRVQTVTECGCDEAAATVAASKNAGGEKERIFLPPAVKTGEDGPPLSPSGGTGGNTKLSPPEGKAGGNGAYVWGGDENFSPSDGMEGNDEMSPPERRPGEDEPPLYPSRGTRGNNGLSPPDGKVGEMERTPADGKVGDIRQGASGEAPDEETLPPPDGKVGGKGRKCGEPPDPGPPMGAPYHARTVGVVLHPSEAEEDEDSDPPGGSVMEKGNGCREPPDPGSPTRTPYHARTDGAVLPLSEAEDDAESNPPGEKAGEDGPPLSPSDGTGGNYEISPPDGDRTLTDAADAWVQYHLTKGACRRRRDDAYDFNASAEDKEVASDAFYNRLDELRTEFLAVPSPWRPHMSDMWYATVGLHWAAKKMADARPETGTFVVDGRRKSSIADVDAEAASRRREAERAARESERAARPVIPPATPSTNISGGETVTPLREAATGDGAAAPTTAPTAVLTAAPADPPPPPRKYNSGGVVTKSGGVAAPASESNLRFEGARELPKQRGAKDPGGISPEPRPTPQSRDSNRPEGRYRKPPDPRPSSMTPFHLPREKDGAGRQYGTPPKIGGKENEAPRRSVEWRPLPDWTSESDDDPCWKAPADYKSQPPVIRGTTVPRVLHVRVEQQGGDEDPPWVGPDDDRESDPPWDCARNDVGSDTDGYGNGRHDGGYSDEGYEDGYQSGYEDGYDDGYDDGYGNYDEVSDDGQDSWSDYS